MGARAVQFYEKAEDTRPIEVTLTVPRCPCQTFADRLRKYRHEWGWREVDLAQALGVHKDTVRNCEAERGRPRLEILRKKGAEIVRALYQRCPGAARDSEANGATRAHCGVGVELLQTDDYLEEGTSVQEGDKGGVTA